MLSYQNVFFTVLWYPRALAGRCRTFPGWTSCYQEPDHPHHCQCHDAGYAEDHAHEAVIQTGRVSSHPGVVKSRGDGQRVHAESHADVRDRQVHRQQLGSF